MRSLSLKGLKFLLELETCSAYLRIDHLLHANLSTTSEVVGGITSTHRGTVFLVVVVTIEAAEEVGVVVTIEDADVAVLAIAAATTIKITIIITPATKTTPTEILVTAQCPRKASNGDAMIQMKKPAKRLRTHAIIVVRWAIGLGNALIEIVRSITMVHVDFCHALDPNPIYLHRLEPKGPDKFLRLKLCQIFLIELSDIQLIQIGWQIPKTIAYVIKHVNNYFKARSKLLEDNHLKVGNLILFGIKITLSNIVWDPLFKENILPILTPIDISYFSKYNVTLPNDILVRNTEPESVNQPVFDDKSSTSSPVAKDSEIDWATECSSKSKITSTSDGKTWADVAKVHTTAPSTESTSIVQESESTEMELVINQRRFAENQARSPTDIYLR